MKKGSGGGDTWGGLESWVKEAGKCTIGRRTSVAKVQSETNLLCCGKVAAWHSWILAYIAFDHGQSNKGKIRLKGTSFKKKRGGIKDFLCCIMLLRLYS